jgi:hypothetical protein
MRKEEITGSTKYLILGAAGAISLCAWILLFIPVVGEIANEYLLIFGNLAFVLWLWTKGVSPFKKNRLFNFFGNLVGGVITFGVWPDLFAMVARTIYTHNKEVRAEKMANSKNESSQIAGSISPNTNTGTEKTKKVA